MKYKLVFVVAINKQHTSTHISIVVSTDMVVALTVFARVLPVIIRADSITEALPALTLTTS